MCAVLIYDRLDFAGVRFLRKAFFHAADIFCGVPKRIVLCADKKQLAADILDLYNSSSVIGCAASESLNSLREATILPVRLDSSEIMRQ